MVQWLRPHASTAGVRVRSLVLELRSCDADQHGQETKKQKKQRCNKTILKRIEEHKSKIGTILGLAITLLGIYPKEFKSGSLRDLNIPMIIAALVTAAKIWKQRKCPSADEPIENMCCITHNGILCRPTKETLQYATRWMKLEDIC